MPEVRRCRRKRRRLYAHTAIQDEHIAGTADLIVFGYHQVGGVVGEIGCAVRRGAGGANPKLQRSAESRAKSRAAKPVVEFLKCMK